MVTISRRAVLFAPLLAAAPSASPFRGIFPNSIVRGPRNGDVGAVATKTKLDDAGKRALRLLWEGISK